MHGNPGITNLEISAIQKVSHFENLQAFPNPTNDILNFDFTILENTKMAFHVFDIQGSLIQRSNTYRVNVGENKIAYDVSNLPQGVYIINVIENNLLTHAVKLIKI